MTLIIPNLVFGIDFSAMTLNVDNLFDTYDDKNKDDKAYLPIELKLIFSIQKCRLEKSWFAYFIACEKRPQNNSSCLSV